MEVPNPELPGDPDQRSSKESEAPVDMEAAVRNAVASLVGTESGFTQGSTPADVKVVMSTDDGGIMEIPEGVVTESVTMIADETAVDGISQVQMTETGIEKVGGKIIEDSMVDQQEQEEQPESSPIIINNASNNNNNKNDTSIREVETEGNEQVNILQVLESASAATGDGSELEVMEIPGPPQQIEEGSSEEISGAGDSTTITTTTAAADQAASVESSEIISTIDDTEASAPWNRNSCIVCNGGMDSIEPADPNQVEGNKKLKKFFLEYLGVNETTDLGGVNNDNTFPFCASCSEDLDKLMALACKIEFMDLQFEKLRDTLARKTVKTYLCRTRPEMLDQNAEQAVDITDEPLDANVPKPLLNPGDVLFNQWKRQYDQIIPGRFKKFPTLMKTVDSKQRVSYYRIDSSGRHHFITTVNADQPSDMPSASPGSPGVKRKVGTVIKINGETVAVKRLKTLSDDRTDDSDEEMDQTLEGDSAEEDRQYKCAVCPKSFSSRSILNYHARVHSAGERPFKCNLCDKTFAQRGGLATHALVHSGEKPYHCDDCGKSFRQKYHLTQHQLIHSGLKPFQCEICHKSFNVKMNLREHMRRHTGERPYRCGYCTCQGFFRKKMLRDHIVKAHPERPLPQDLETLGPTPKFPKGRLASSKVHEEIQNILDSKLAAKFINRRITHIKPDHDEGPSLVSVRSQSVPQLGNILAEDSQQQTITHSGEEASGSSVQTIDLLDKKHLPQQNQVEAHFEPIMDDGSSGQVKGATVLMSEEGLESI